MWRKFCSVIFHIKIKAVLIILLYFISSGADLCAQKQSYQIKKADIIYCGISLLSLGSFYYFQQQVRPLTEQQINTSDPGTIPSYDKVAIHHYDIHARKLSNILIYASFITKAAMVRKETKKDILAIGIVGYQSILLSQAIANGFKLSLRSRPYVYNPSVPMDIKMSRDARFSFFSSHTTTVSSLCFTTAYAFKVYHPDSKYKNMIWVSAFALPALEGFLRVKSGKHYPSDVLTGYLIGWGTSYLMHRLHKRK